MEVELSFYRHLKMTALLAEARWLLFIGQGKLYFFETNEAYPSFEEPHAPSLYRVRALTVE
jgi:hypothetical protein